MHGAAGTAPGATKGLALARLAGSLGIVAEQVLAFGDMPNDFSMFTWAGRSVAVGNAHPAVMSATSGLTVRNDDDGVAPDLERLLDERFSPAQPGRHES